MTKRNPYCTLSFFTRKPRSGTETDHKVYLRISVAGEHTDLFIGRTVSPSSWDTKRKMSKGRSQRDHELNHYLDETRARLYEIHSELVRSHREINPTIMRDMFLGKAEKPMTLCDIFREANKSRKEEYEHGYIVKATYDRWERCITYLTDFFRSKLHVNDVPVGDITSGMLDDFEHFLRIRKGCANNAAVRYMRCVKNTIRYALAQKWLSHDPFIGKRYHRTHTERQFLTESEIMAILSLDFTELPRLDVVRDTFVFCCFTGLAFGDMKSLMLSDIRADENGILWIRKPRAKTGIICVIPLMEIPRRIISKYSRHPAVKDTGVALPAITNQKTNAYLKEIADLARIKKPLTTHVARHTFASMALNNNVSIEVIAKVLGHSDIKTTQIYARMQDQAVYDGMATMREKFNAMQIP